MKTIAYLPTPEINDFHNRGIISLRVFGTTAQGTDGEVYRINRGQAKRLARHFCGVSGCGCAAGAVEQLNESGDEWGIKVKWCKEK